MAWIALRNELPSGAFLRRYIGPGWARTKRGCVPCVGQAHGVEHLSPKLRPTKFGCFVIWHESEGDSFVLHNCPRRDVVEAMTAKIARLESLGESLPCCGVDLGQEGRGVDLGQERRGV